MEFLSEQVGPFTVLQWLTYVFVAVVGLNIARSFLGKVQGTNDRDFVSMRCAGCTWSGKVSKFHRTCPKCGNHISATTP